MSEDALKSLDGKISNLPFVTVRVDPAFASEENPNGVRIITNMQPGKADMMVIRLLAEGIQQVTDAIQRRSGLVMPDGSPIPNGVSHEKSR